MEYRRYMFRKERPLLSQSKCIHTFYTQPELRDDLLLLEVTQCPSS